MKKIITYFFLGCFSYVVSSCSDLAFGDSFLEKAPGVDVTVDTIFSSKLYADRALNSAYSTLRTGLTVHANNGNFEYQQAGNKLGWDNLDALTDIIRFTIMVLIVRSRRMRIRRMPRVQKWGFILIRM